MTFSKKQLSRVRGRKRYSAWVRENAIRLEQKYSSFQYNEKGEAIGLGHRVSPLTGEYNGRKVLRVRASNKAAPTKVRA